MTSDDDRISYLSGDAAVPLDDADRRDLDELRALLADPSLWAEPSPELEDAVVAAVSREASVPAPTPAPTPTRRRPASRWQRPVLIGAAAAVLVVVLIVGLALGLSGDRNAEQAEFAASLEETELVPGATGRATFTQTPSGWRIELDATGLPRLDGGRFYQAWLRNEAGVLVTVGTFNEADDVVLWAGVSPAEFGMITVTEEAADGDPASSGRRVLVGTITEN